MHDDAYIGGRSENNIKCIVHDDLGGRTNQLDIFCHVTGFTIDFLSFTVVELIRFFHGAISIRGSSCCTPHIFKPGDATAQLCACVCAAGGKRVSSLVSRGATQILLHVLVSESKDDECLNELLVAVHQLLAKLAPRGHCTHLPHHSLTNYTR